MTEEQQVREEPRKIYTIAVDDPNDTVQQAIASRCQAIARAMLQERTLGVEQGPSHIEVFSCANREERSLMMLDERLRSLVDAGTCRAYNQALDGLIRDLIRFRMERDG